MSDPQPGGGGHLHRSLGIGAMSYSDRLKTNVRYDQRLKRNVLEITLEKADPSIDIDVEHSDIARSSQVTWD